MQNLDQICVQFNSYGEVPESRQSEIIQNLSEQHSKEVSEYHKLADVIVERLKKESVR